MAAALRKQIPGHFLAMRQHQSLLTQSVHLVALAYGGKLTDATRVQIKILARLAAMSRIVHLSVERSYVIEALALMAPAYELAYNIGFIGQDKSRAKSWERHQDTKVSYPHPNQRERSVRATLELNGYSGKALREAVAAEERNYHGYCAAKHGNPMLLRNWGVQHRDGKLYLAQGPFLTELTYRQAGLVLGLAARTMYRAVGGFVRPHLKSAPAKDLKRFAAAAGRAQEGLRQANMRLHIPKTAA
ncbi:MAG TPA: hypothetical protein PKA66_14760 [Gemmatimonadales bacterium]|nr:hypothetical protein [Gemmatimonadales bacterium]